MAARGYHLARIEVEASVGRIPAGANAGIVASRHHSTWFRELFAPSVAAGLLKAQDVAGYPGHQAYMPVRAVLGHLVFVFTHPYRDGNGRMGGP